MLISGKEILKVANENKFAVPAFNAGSGQLLDAVMQACEETKSPVMIAIHPDELKFLTDSFVAQVKYFANNSNVPVCIHLDHGASYEQVIHAIQLGFTSVMIDASHLSFEENIEVTKKVVSIAHPVGVSVEAELGTIGDTGNTVEGGVSEVIYTDPSTAQEFLERTGVDSLAIAIGTAHGIYPKNMKPELKLDILKKTSDLTDIPLVLHGGSSNPDNEIQEAVKLGINKINISSDIKIAFTNKLREVLEGEDNEAREPNVLFPSCIEETKKIAVEKINLFNSVDKANLY
ncbi:MULTISPECIES: ketose-bisphosphate aldolase [Mammaliicoccus]|jgi:fructose-bisphosphate aldolase class II|uniref:Ketose-bisphosphate aldolase n=1 Tax=Mammaliicoccus lentus TaxID=42858 RepID=A0AAX3W5E8_MAMLE|nr:MULTISPECIES: ketose-bisphosphate aldolase [Mammaliicoccus]MBF0748599.1 ketose-bisphosphate aldolase [Mammaliicoccus lentus]MBU6113410.1 ketose-bisphosphate aldolase [Mammaliicoccus lentus]MEB5687066.1 ketose-bisphosphate aldolase [Mammaliicoccus lentus]TFU58590.1 ketose-bisphosphate aldolase [Mammaliicoccus lentus]WHI60588.1 ketose-bisphosphate aldolase [Mammaliicoccus lentus]